MRHIWSLLLGILFFLLFYGMWSFYADSNKTYQIKIAASGKGDSYKVAQAIATVTNNHYPYITIEVVSTLGSTQSEKLLSQNLVDLAMVQADTTVGALKDEVAGATVVWVFDGTSWFGVNESNTTVKAGQGYWVK